MKEFCLDDTFCELSDNKVIFKYHRYSIRQTKASYWILIRIQCEQIAYVHFKIIMLEYFTYFWQNDIPR